MATGRVLADQWQRSFEAHRAKFGEVHPAIHADFKGHKFVAVGNTFLHSDRWKTFVDFLFDYPTHVLSRRWCQTEAMKPHAERHVILRWHSQMVDQQRKADRGADGLFCTAPNGAMRAYLMLAYDLYAVQHHCALQAVVVKRLKHKDQFQGARHELFAAATCIRAGYDLEHEDEQDNTRRHPELIATHRTTREKIAVEAKSRHRDGVLGRAGMPKPEAECRVGITRLLKDAIEKPVSHPYVIFFDLNLPTFPGFAIGHPWFEEIADSVVEIAKESGPSDPFNLIVFSNQPDHYLEPEVPSPGGTVLSVVGRNPKHVLRWAEALPGLHEAARKFGVIPQSFEEAAIVAPKPPAW